jgi:DMSO reductase family type II enzyme heme b subunit
MNMPARLLFALLASVASIAHAEDVILAKQTSGRLPLDPDDALWQTAPATTLRVYPQNTVRLPDKITESATVTVRALYGAEELGLHLEWSDASMENARGVGKFADAAAVQWPTQFGPGTRLPYIGMGNPGEPVALWLWRADGTAETLAAEGFGTLTAQTTDGMQAQGAWKDGRWRVAFRRGLAAGGEYCVRVDSAKQGLVPVALAVWNGATSQRDGAKRLSAWQILRFEKGAADARYAGQLAASIKGDPATGKRLMMEKGCAACHAYPGNPAQPVIGPDLSYAGGIHRAGYLLESIAEPSRVVVPGKGYSMTQDGKKVSLMPPFQGTEQERHDIAVFLQTLR